MKLIVSAVLSCFVLAVVLPANPASAAPVEGATGTSLDAMVGASGVTELGKPPNVPPENPGKGKVKVPKDKDKRSKKNPNDGKDNDPDDGDAGRGNDDKTKKNDGPARD